MAFYERLAREVNDACDKGRIEARSRGIGFMPPLRREYAKPVADAFCLAVRSVATLDRLGMKTPPSKGSPESMVLFADMTRGRLSPTPDGSPPPSNQVWLDRARLAVLGGILQLSSWVAPWVFGAGFLAGLASVVVSLARRRMNYFVLVWTGLTGSCVALALIVALFEATSTFAIHQAYLTGAYGFSILLPFVSWLSWRELSGGGAGAETKPGLIPGVRAGECSQGFGRLPWKICRGALPARRSARRAPRAWRGRGR